MSELQKIRSGKMAEYHPDTSASSVPVESL